MMHAVAAIPPIDHHPELAHFYTDPEHDEQNNNAKDNAEQAMTSRPSTAATARTIIAAAAHLTFTLLIAPHRGTVF